MHECVCVCVCVLHDRERGRDRKRQRETGRVCLQRRVWLHVWIVPCMKFQQNTTKTTTIPQPLNFVQRKRKKKKKNMTEYEYIKNICCIFKQPSHVNQGFLNVCNDQKKKKKKSWKTKLILQWIQACQMMASNLQRAPSLSRAWKDFCVSQLFFVLHRITPCKMQMHEQMLNNSAKHTWRRWGEGGRGGRQKCKLQV